MKRLFIATILVAMALSAQGQKIVIGGKVPEIKSDRVEWLTRAPTKSRAVLYDFYSSENPSCVKDYALLAPIYKSFAGKVDIVVISPKSTSDFKLKSNSDGSKYSFAVDDDGDIFAAFGVQYLPFYMLVNEKGEMVWQGNISALTIAQIKELI